MDPIGHLQPIIVPAQAPSVPAPSQAPAVPVPPSQQRELSTVELAAAKIQSAELKRYEAVKNLAQDIANVFVVSDKRFTIFKDAAGQYVTRFTSLRDGRVTYIPEPELFKMRSTYSGDVPSIVQIKA